MKITNPELKVVRFDAEDVIATSLYYAPAAAFNATQGTSFTSDYVQFEGTMVGSGPDAWMITNVRDAIAADSDSIDGLKSGGSYYFSEFGITVDMSNMAPLAQQAYDAYEYEGGLYTRGATYYETYWQ